MAVVFLIARECQGIERERIVFRRSHLLLDQRPQHACFDVRQSMSSLSRSSPRFEV